MAALRGCFARTQTWLQARKYMSALASDLPRRNGWTIAEQCGDRSPDRTQRLLNRASWDEAAAMSVIRRYAAAGLDAAAGRRGGLRAGILDETGQQKTGQATAGVQYQYLGCAGRVVNGISTVHLSYAREGTGHVLACARQWIPAGQIADPVRARAAGLPPGLVFRTKGQLAAGILADAYADGLRFDVICGDEVYGASRELREFLEDRQQAYVLQVSCAFTVTLPGGTELTCDQAARQLTGDPRRWEARSAGPGSKGQRWYAWAWIAAASPRHHLLIRRHLATGELAFHWCYVPEGQPVTMTRLVRAAGLRWPVEEDFRVGKGCFGLDQCQARLYTAIQRHLVLVMAALAICAVTAARLRHRTSTQAPLPRTPGQAPPPDPGMIPLTVPETARLLTARQRPHPPGHAIHWLNWRRRHQARSRWHHHRTRLKRDYTLVT